MIFCLILCFESSAQLKFIKNGFRVVDYSRGAPLFKKDSVIDGINCTIYCQVLDLRFVKLSNFVVEAINKKALAGKYLTDDKNLSSPYFNALHFQNALSKIQQKEQSKPLGIISGSFFEFIENSTPLSFPLKDSGKIVIAGSSSNGPHLKQTTPFYKSISLKALVWNDSMVTIKNYDTKTGFPLTEDSFINGFVSYSYDEHPAIFLRPTQLIDKYIVVGTFSSNGSKEDNSLAILSVTVADIKVAAETLKQLGVISPIIALTGGGSGFIYNAKAGYTVSTLEEKNVNIYEPLPQPHYLYFTKKN